MEEEYPHPKYFLALLTFQAARNLISYYNRELEPMGLTGAQANALGILFRKKNLSLGEFAARAGIGKAAAVSMIHRLTETGFVTAVPDPNDARKNIINVTDKAIKVIAPAMEIVRHLESTVEEALGEDVLKTLVDALKVIRNLEF
ncbi:DNA-binding transcriptional regulator, MarR family [Desulfatibacillum alkenivorans DSM 16219]|jgi:DNA-binding MarR family transcriptional regulator|uniref:DNA-binding transcriptional regulator, MarR family n=1 Tax=Desulfatibacillum alkenivorans DSM 16219 TaxID=1121393 RepID=A0A1M6ZM10_9BACT|nr:MarR family transcriptional regulator [Desulfatibacillum alkenivorans]SHL31531.1 DNA-binding transcriptional regulator, MarR family [Desulfatibacillum alkenivorans DSM 16219]